MILLLLACATPERVTCTNPAGVVVLDEVCPGDLWRTGDGDSVRVVCMVSTWTGRAARFDLRVNGTCSVGQ